MRNHLLSERINRKCKRSRVIYYINKLQNLLRKYTNHISFTQFIWHRSHIHPSTVFVLVVPWWFGSDQARSQFLLIQFIYKTNLGQNTKNVNYNLKEVRHNSHWVQNNFNLSHGLACNFIQPYKNKLDLRNTKIPTNQANKIFICLTIFTT